MKLVADVDSISSNLNALSTEIESFSSAVSSYDGASINCSLEEVSGVLDSFKNAIGDELNKLNTSSHEYNTLVEECCNEYKANEEKTQSISIDSIDEIVKNNSDITFDYQGEAATKLTKIPSTEFASSGRVTDIMQKIADVASNNSGGGYDNMCEAWAELQWQNATGMARECQPSTYDAYKAWGVSTSKDNIPVGAMVYGSGSPTVDSVNNPYGHVGIYVGDGMVADQGGVVSLDQWISWQHANCDGHQGWLGWGWQNGIDLTKK